MKHMMSFLFMMLSCSYIVFAADQPEYFMFMGNPGVGKSAIINSLIGKKVAKSGVSAGSGMTSFFRAYEHDGKQYFDTPGLADTKMREQAAREIESALKKDGKYHLFFVMTLEAGRVRPSDVTTINTVMAAIKNNGHKFNVIINKLTKLEKDEIASNPVAMASVYEQINSGTHKTNSIWYIDKDRYLEDGDRDFINIDANINDYIFHKSLSINIAKENVEKIQIDEFEQVKAEFEKSLSVLREQITLSNSKYENLFGEMSRVQEGLRESQRELSQARKKAAEDMAKAVADKEEEMRRRGSICPLF